ncbi:hypothetical protein [Chimaeribacter arupi]|uniref:hypothetical protein n=1 Tax=Chimaeribacter arupi TaxID=2060066 RepID=UPI0011AEFD64|nr:hypothetical protein [Chimaeribacter arupi]
MAETIEILLIGGLRDDLTVVIDKDGKIPRFHENKVGSSHSSKSSPLLLKEYFKREITIDGKRYAYGYCETIDESEVVRRIKASSLKPIQ